VVPPKKEDDNGSGSSIATTWRRAGPARPAPSAEPIASRQSGCKRRYLYVLLAATTPVSGRRGICDLRRQCC